MCVPLTIAGVVWVCACAPPYVEVGPKYYQYTITGFKMEMREAPLSPWVRFYSSRKDTIYIDSTKAGGRGGVCRSSTERLDERKHLVFKKFSLPNEERNLLFNLEPGFSACA